MAIIEKNVLLQKKNRTGDCEAIYPTAKIENVIDDEANTLEEYLGRQEIKTITVSEWTRNSNTGNYEYVNNDTKITENHLIEVHMDLANQDKVTRGYTESFNGGFKIILAEKPVVDVTINISIQRMLKEVNL